MLIIGSHKQSIRYFISVFVIVCLNSSHFLFVDLSIHYLLNIAIYDIQKHTHSFRCNVHHSAQHCYCSPTPAPGNWG